MIKKITVILMCASLLQCELTYFDPFVFSYLQNYINDKEKPHGLKNYRHTALLQSESDGPIPADAYCKTFTDCQTCLRSEKYICGWCHKYGCVNNAHLLCPMAENSRSLKTQHQSNCTIITRCQSYYDENRLGISINVKMQVADPAVYQQNINCLITFSETEKVALLSGRIVGDEVWCQPIEKPEVAYLQATVQLFWGGAMPVSNPLPLVLYSCSRMAESCEGCAKVPEQFGCGWCAGSVKCTPKSHCFGKWSSDKSFCSNLMSPFHRRRKYISYKVTGVPALESYMLDSATPSTYFQLPVMHEMSLIQLKS